MSKSVRIPDRIAIELHEIAKRERRSFANTVEVVLELGLTEMQAGHERTAPARRHTAGVVVTADVQPDVSRTVELPAADPELRRYTTGDKEFKGPDPKGRRK